jgi:hypothetical protein
VDLCFTGQEYSTFFDRKRGKLSSNLGQSSACS